jgi:phosphoribosylglycinamide formyltransferase-1
LAVFASGQGTNFEVLARASRRGELGGAIRVLLCDRPDAGVIARATRLGVEVVTPPTGGFRTRLADERPWLEALRARAIEVVLLAGFMRRLHAPLLEAFRDRILNIHPSLLPAFPGLDAIGRAWESGVTTSGCTVHLVEDALDSGPILASAEVTRREDDTRGSFEARIHEAEHRLYPATVRRFLTVGWTRVGNVVRWEDEAVMGGSRS